MNGPLDTDIGYRSLMEKFALLGMAGGCAGTAKRTFPGISVIQGQFAHSATTRWARNKDIQASVNFSWPLAEKW